MCTYMDQQVGKQITKAEIMPPRSQILLNQPEGKLNTTYPKAIKLESDQASTIRSNYQFTANTED